ncbi:DegT/DnrJ/EryC1/StrS family aminotransferase [Desulfobacterales bacterium HSG17]|nr:DegT/DnrJ/EryC1/StrS family aminotransferase [Desulfobacterales bacterium HSG17]
MKSQSLKNIIPHSKPTLGQEEIEAVSKVISSGQIAQGEVTLEFERAFASFIGSQYAASTSSGTAALHLVLMAMGIGQGDEVIIPSYVCTALLNAVYYVGAVPVIADICPETFNICPEHVKKLITPAARALIVPHMFGLAADMDVFLSLGVPVIEDCAQAVGSLYNREKNGSLGHAAIFSFYATKMMTTGEGGMIVSGSKSLIERIKDLKNYDNRENNKVRYNYKMTDMQAAMGLVQLKKLPEFIKRRKAVACLYDKGFSGFGLQIPALSSDHIYYRYVIRTENNIQDCILKLDKKGIHCARPVFLPIHRLLKLKVPQNRIYNTDKAWKQALSIPVYPSLLDHDVEKVIEAVLQILHNY